MFAFHIKPLIKLDNEIQRQYIKKWLNCVPVFSFQQKIISKRKLQKNMVCIFSL